MKTMKRVLSLLLTIAMVFSLSIHAFAADNSGVTIELTPSTSELTVGDEFTVTATICANSGFNAMDFQLSYDETVVEFLGFDSVYDEAAEKDVLTSNFTAGSLVVFNNADAYIAMARENNTTKTGTLFVANFKAIAEGSPAITSNEEKLNLGEGNGVAVTASVDTSACDNIQVEKAMQAADVVLYESSSADWINNAPVYVDKLTLKNTAVEEFHWDGNDCYITLHKNTAPDAAFILYSNVTVKGQPQMMSMFSMTFDGTKYQATTSGTVTYNGVLNEGKADVEVTASASNLSGTKTFHFSIAGAETQTYEVSSKGKNYSIAAEEGSASPVNAGGSYSFKVVLDQGYKAGETFAVKANGTVLTADENGVYTISNINENQQITVEGIEVAVSATGYTAYLTQDSVNKTVGENAVVSIQVLSEEQNSFNTFYAELTYDPAYLTLQANSGSDFEVTDENGSVKIVAYGADRALGKVLDLSFTVANTPEEGTSVTLNKAHIDVSANAVASDAPAAVLGDAEVSFAAGAYTVNLPDWFKGDATVDAGEDYTFTAKDTNYTYTINVTMGDEAVEVINNNDGSFTIENIRGNLNITAERTAKSYPVTVNGANENQVIYEETAAYMTEYSFTVAAVEGHSTVVAMTIAGAEYTGFAAENGVYTIPGEHVVGDIVINVTNTASQYTWIFEGTGAGDASTVQTTLSHGENFIFTVTKEEGFTYAIGAVMGDKEAEIITNEDGSLCIENVKGNLLITVEKSRVEFTVEVSDFVKVDNGTVAQLVTASAESLKENQTMTYNGEPMYWSEKYQSFVYLKLTDDLTVISEEENPVSVIEGERISIDYSGDVNGTTSIDVNDAQLVYDIYNAKYTDFTLVNMFKFLCADINGDRVIDVKDAAAIVNEIINHN